jgi:hypothetical protein
MVYVRSGGYWWLIPITEKQLWLQQQPTHITLIGKQMLHIGAGARPRLTSAHRRRKPSDR